MQQEVVLIQSDSYQTLYIEGRKVLEDVTLDGYSVLEEVCDLGSFTIREVEAYDDEVFDALWENGIGFPQTVDEVDTILKRVL